MSLITVMRSKLHMATVTDVNQNYEGSIGIYSGLAGLAGFYANEQLHVLNMENGKRVITYLIPSEKPDEVCVNGAAAKFFEFGDRIIVIAYATIDFRFLTEFTSTTLVLGNKNQIVKTKETRCYEL